MGLIGRVLSVIKATRRGVSIIDVKSDPGGGPNITSEQYTPAGDDSQPLPGDYGYAAPTPQKGRRVVLGYIDPVNAPITQPGDKRIYGRDADTGVQVCQVWLKNDGTVLLSNDSGSVTLQADGAILGQNSAGQFELEAGGDFVANGAKMLADGDVVTSDGISLRNHTHPYTWTDPAGSGNTGAPQ